MGREPPHRSSRSEARRHNPSHRPRTRAGVHLAPSTRIEQVVDGRFQLIELAGAGSEGETWRALDLTTGATVALKLSPPHQAVHVAFGLADSVCSVNLPQLKAHGRTPGGRHYQATAWLEGDDLAHLLAVGPVPVGIVAWVGCHIARGLAALHAVCQVHGDVRPKNVRLVRAEGVYSHAVILDRLAPGQRGNLRTESPECAASGTATEGSDLYSLGCVLHWALTGRPPFDGEPSTVLALHRYAPRPALPAGVPPALGRLVFQLMDVDPDGRPASAAGVAEMLGWIAADGRTEQGGLLVSQLLPQRWPHGPLSFGGDLLCGRDREMQWLAQRALDATGGPTLLCVHGPAGIGVSRLLRWLVEAALARGMSATFGAIAGNSSDVGTPVRSFNIQVEAEAATERKARALAEELIERGGLWVLDDAQDLASADLSAAVRAVQIATAKGVRVVLVLGWHAGASGDALPQPRVQVQWLPDSALELAPLDSSAVASWVGRVSPRSDPGDAIAATGGVPARMIEWACVQAKLSRNPSASPQFGDATACIRAAGVPQSRSAELRGLLGRAGEHRGRLRAVLHAVVLSRSPLDLDDLAVAFGEQLANFEVAIALALERQVLCQGARPGQFRISTTAWQLAITESFGDSARATHTLLAQIAAIRPERTLELPHHLWRADAPVAAWTAARVAISRALDMPNYRLADELLGDVERFGEESGTLSVLDWATVLRQRATVLIHLGRSAEAETRFGELRALDLQFSPSSPEAAVTGFGWVGLAAAAEARGEYSNAAVVAEGGLARHTASSPVRAELLLMLGKGRLLMGDNAAADHAMLRAEQAFDFLGQAEGQWRAWVELALVAVYRRDVATGRKWLTAVDRVTALDPLLHARKLYIDGMLEEASGHPEEAMVRLRAAASELELMGHLRGLAGALAGQAIALRRMARFAEADQVLSAAIESRVAVGDQRGLVQTLNNLADLRVVSGRPADAVGPAQQALLIAQQLGRNIHSIFAHCTLAEAYFALGQYEMAEQSASTSLAMNGEPAARPAAAVTCLGVLAEIAARQGNHARAYELMKHAAQLQLPCGTESQSSRE